MRDPNCIFCKIASGDIKSEILHQDDDVMVFRDANPKAPFHALVIPREHVASLLEAREPRLLGLIVLAAAKVASEGGYGRNGFRVVANSGPDAGQSVAHLHFHVLAGRKLDWPPG